MAKKTTAKQNTNNGESKFKGIRNFFTSERTRFITGLVISIVTIYVGLALISFFFTGGADQSKIENIPLSDLVINRGSVENWTGVRGAFLADLLMNRWFGISSFLILFFLGSVGAKLMNLSRVSLLKRFLFSAAMLIWGSLFFAFIFIRGYEDTFIYLGGQHGYYLSEVMMNNIGIRGTVLLLVGLFLIVAIFTSKRTIPFLQNVFSFGWLKNRLKRDKSETTEVPEEEEDVEGEAEVYAPVEKTVAAPQPVAYRETVEENIGPDEYVYDTETEMRKAEVETEVPQKDDFEFEVARGDDPVVEAGNGNNTIFEVEVPEEEEEFDQSQLGKYDPRLDLSRYMFPTLDLLKFYDSGNVEVNREELEENQQMIKRTLEDFGINIASIKATVGPTVTLYEIIPEAGVRISKIKNLEDDIALSLSALQIRIIAPMPGKGTIGIEVPNNKPQTVSMQSVVASRKFQECTYDLPVAIGRTIVNEVFMFDLCKTPHLLVAGATGQGKSVGLNAIITSLLYKKHPSQLKFVMVDPKKVELSIYSIIEKHFLAKLPDEEEAIITETAKVVNTLNSLCIEMDSRYDLLKMAQVRNIKEYNEKFIKRQLNPNNGHKYLPYIVVVVDEFADLIMTAGKEVETPIARIAQLARAVGIHMIIATQRPSTNIITGVIKANFPARIAFKVASMIDSRTILDSPGANQLIGRGDMLISVGSEMTRVQCAFVDTPEVDAITHHIASQQSYPSAFALPEYVPENEGNGLNDIDPGSRDPLFEEAARLVVSTQQGSTSSIQRRFSIGYNRAGRIMDQLEAAGIVGPFEGSKARQVLISDEYSLEQMLK